MNSQDVFDEGYNDEDQTASSSYGFNELLSGIGSVQECEGKSLGESARDIVTNAHLELAYQLLASLPRARLATIQRRLAPLLQFDVVGVSSLCITRCFARR